MGKSTNFSGQPLLAQVLKFFDKDKILRMSRKKGGERYVKSFDGWHHLVVMLCMLCLCASTLFARLLHPR